MKKWLVLPLLLLLFPTLAFSLANVRNVSVTGNCYTAGQNITVNFEYKVGTNLAWISYGVGFSGSSSQSYTNDWVVTDGGIYDASLAAPDTNGHYGRWLGQISDTNWYSFAVVVKVPSGYTGTKYVFVNVKENSQYSYYSDPGDYDASASTSMGVCSVSTPTITKTITPTITETITKTATPTITQTITKTITKTITQTITHTITPTITATITKTITETITKTATSIITVTITQTITPTITETATQTITETITPTITPTITFTITETITPTFTITPTITETITPTITPTTIPTPDAILQPTNFNPLFYWMLWR